MKRKGLVTGVGLIACCSILFSVSASLMWFDNRTRIAPNQIVGSSNGAYYASGDGSKDDPFVINQPRHLYNLAWLQYLGAYNQEEDGTVKGVYFRVEGNSTNEGGDSILDMDGWTLPPIGTEENPFVGNFNGNDTIIKNLTVSNTFSDYGDAHPYYNADGKEMTEDNFVQPKIIGFFGVVGALDTKTYEYTTNIAVEGAAYTEANLVYDTYVDNITIQNKTSNQELLAGLLAGYVNAPIRQCGVGYGEFSFASGTKNLSTTNTPSGATIKGVSNYSLIGAYNPDKFEYTGLPSTDGGSGDGNDWGGSIDTTTLVKRIYYMAGTGYTDSSSTLGTNEQLNFSNQKAPEYDKNKYNVYYKSNSLDGDYIWNSSKGTIQYLYEGTYLPLNVDTITSFNTEIDSSVSGTSNWKTTEYYKNHTSEYNLISKSNTGYIVGGGIPTSSGGLPTGTSGKYIYLRKEIQFSTNLSNSISSSEYDANNVKIYTVDTSSGSTTNQITSSSNFQRYSDVKSDFDSKMSETKSYCYAIRFQSINATSSSNWSDKITVMINGGEKENYQFLKSAINFTVNKPGYITVIISSFSNMGTKMFDLFKIDRNSDNSINKITQINKIYGEANSGIYYYDDTSKSSNLLFNFENTHSLNTKSLYYFEIPVNAGDYAICKHSTTEGTDTSTGYLNYLDIGSNAGDSGGGDEPSKTSPTEIDFVYYGSDKKLVKIVSDGTYVNSEVVFQIDSGASGTIAFKRTYTDGTSIVYYYIPTASSINSTAIGTDGKSSQSDSELAEN